MRQLNHIKRQRNMLEQRSQLLQQIRSFFIDQKFVEIEAPSLVVFAGQEPYLSPFSLSLSDEKGHVHQAYLHTSPEYTMKKVLAAGIPDIFYLGKAFRNEESFGGAHNPEFTMLEWYRAGASIYEIMDDCEALLHTVKKEVNLVRKTMRELWRELLDLDLADYLTDDALWQLCAARGYKPDKDEPYEDLFFRIFLNDIEPKLSKYPALIISHYPAQMAALAKLSPNKKYAERFELYLNGIEIANAFSELTDVAEQRRRFEEEQQRREVLGKSIIPIDEEFLSALAYMPEAGGIALGVDRLMQWLLGCKKIDDVLVLPASKQFISFD